MKQPRTIGIDLGIKNWLILSNGVAIAQHESLQPLRKRLAKHEAKLNGQVPNSQRWCETQRRIERTKLRILNAQQDLANKIAEHVTSKYKILCIEQFILGPQVIANKVYYRAVIDARWELLTKTIEKKAKERNCIVVSVPPYFTSQECYMCGARKKLTLEDRNYHCDRCGFECDRDVQAAMNIRKKGLAKLTKAEKAKPSFPPF